MLRNYRHLKLRTISDSIHIIHVIHISSYFIISYFTFIRHYIIFLNIYASVQLVYDYYIRLKCKNCHGINFAICQLMNCIEFTDFFLLFFSLTSGFVYLLFLNNVLALVAYVIAVAPIIWISKSYLDIHRIYKNYFMFCSEIYLFLLL